MQMLLIRSVEIYIVDKYRLQGSCKTCNENIKRMDIYKFEFPFSHFRSYGYGNVFHRQFLILNMFTFGKEESLKFMTFHDMHACTHTRT
jgi:hypothetical protein